MGEREKLTKKYEELGISQAISRPWHYSTACHELSSILRFAYSNLPKNLQSLVLQDVLSAFRILPEIQTGYEKSSAISLLQSAEAILPKQKKSIVCSEYKHSIVAYKRRSKSLQQSVTLEVPEDILIHILSFLDIRSLISASSVCRSWNRAANEKSIWEMQYSILFGHHDCSSCKRYEFDCTNTFELRYFANLSFKTGSSRAICTDCQSIIWLSDLTCTSPHLCPKLGKSEMKIRLLSPKKVAKYLIGESELNEFSSDSDDDSDLDENEFNPKLWAFPNVS